MKNKRKYIYKLFEIDRGALSIEIYQEKKNLIEELNNGWEIVFHDYIDSDDYFILRKKI